MANKEEVIFKVKAELEGFRKSMDELKKMAKESSKNIEKSMNLNLTDEGKKAGQTFAKGFNKEIKNLTDSLEKELKTMANQTYNVKIKLDSSSIEQVKSELSDIEVTVTSSASSRASSSMSNNANAPNSINSMMSAANSAALLRLTDAMSSATRAVDSVVPKMDDVKVKVDTTDAKIKAPEVKVDTENARVGVDTKDAKVKVDTDNVKVGVDTSNVKIDIPEVKVDTDNVKVGVDTENAKINIPEIELKAPQIDPIEVNVKVQDIPEVKVDVPEINPIEVKVEIPDIPDVKVDTSDVKIDIPDIEIEIPKINPIEINIDSAVEKLENSAKNMADVIKTVGPTISESINDSAKTISKTIKNNLKDANSIVSEIKKAIRDAKTIAPEIKRALDSSAKTIKRELDVALKELSKTVGQEINNAFKSSTQTIATEIKTAFVDAVKLAAPQLSAVIVEAVQKASVVTTKATKAVKTQASKSNTVDDLGFKNFKAYNPRTYAMDQFGNVMEQYYKPIEQEVQKVQESIKETSEETKKAYEQIKKAREAALKTKSFKNLESLDNKTLEEYKKNIDKKAKLDSKLAGLRKSLKGTESGTEKYKDITNEIIKLQKELKDTINKIKECEAILKNGRGLSEMSMTIDDANESVTKLRMNLQLLAKDSGADKLSDKFKKLSESIRKSLGFNKKQLNDTRDIKVNSTDLKPTVIEGTYRVLGDEISWLAKLMQKLESVAKNVFSSIGSAFDKLRSKFKKSSDPMGDMPFDINGQKLIAPLNVVVSSLGTVQTATRQTKQEIESTCRVLEDEVSWFSKLENIAKNVFSSIAGLGSKLKGFVSKPITGIKSAFNSIRMGDVDAANKQLKEYGNKLKEIKKTIKDFGKDAKNAFSNLGNVVNKILHPIKSIGDGAKKAASGFKHMGNEANTASGKVNKLKGAFTGLLGKLTIYFGIYEMFNLFKEGTKDAMKYEATIMNLQRTFGKASQSLIDFANTNAVAFGLSKRQVAEYGNIYSAIMRDVNRAMNPDASADAIAKKTMGMSEELLKSAGIISSALGYDMEYVLEGLRSGLLGSSQAVDQFGLNLKRNNLETSKAFQEVANGVDSWEKLSVAQQQYVITQEIINQTTSKFGSILDKNGKIMQSTASLHAQFLAQWANTKLAIGNLGKVIWTAVVGPLTKALAVLEVIFNYAASAMTALLKMFGIKVDLNANLGGTDKLNESLNNLGDSTSTTDELGDSLNNVGESAQDTAKDTEDAAKKIKRALAGFDQINVLSLGEDEDGGGGEDPPIELPEWNPTPVDPDDFGVQLPDLGNEFKANLDKFKNLLEELMTPFRAAWDLLGDRWIKAWDRLKSSFKNFCESLSDFLQSVWWNGGQEFVRHMAEIALAVGIAAMEIGGTILDSLAKLWKHLDPSTNINTKGLLDALNEVSVKIKDLLLDLNGHFESLMNNGGQDVLNALGDMFMNLGEAAVRGVGIVVDAIDGLLDHLDPATNKKTQGALGGLEYLFKSIGQFALGLTDAFATFMDNGGQDFLNNMGDIVMILIDMAATITGDLLNAITAFFDSWAGHVVITVAGRALELVSSIIKGLLEILEPLTPVISAVVAAIGAFMVASKVVTAITTIVSAFQSFGSILGLAKAGVSALWAIIAANPIAATVAAIVAIGVALVALYNKCEWFRDAVDGILEAFSGLFDALKETFSNILEDVTNIFQDVIDIIVGIFTGDGEKVGEAVRSLVENILDLLWDLVTGVVDIGWNLITGLVEGIWEGIKALPQLLAGIGEFVIDFFKGLFGIHSPSTVFAELGGYLIEGLIQGISDSVPSLGDIFNGVSDAISGAWDKVEKAWDGASDFFSGIGESVKGVLDTIKNTSIPKPKIEWDKVKESASKIVDNIKTTVEKFKADLPKPKVSWNDLTTSLSKILDNLKRTISNFKWELPKPKLPKFSVTGGQAPWGFMGKGSMPKIDIKWFKTGGIMTSATLFGMSGNTLLGGGEAGAEAILPLDELWSRLDDHFNQQNALLRSTVANSNGNNSNRPVNIVLKVNDIEMGKAVVSSLKALSNHSGTLDLPLR